MLSENIINIGWVTSILLWNIDLHNEICKSMCVWMCVHMCASKIETLKCPFFQIPYLCFHKKTKEARIKNTFHLFERYVPFPNCGVLTSIIEFILLKLKEGKSIDEIKFLEKMPPPKQTSVTLRFLYCFFIINFFLLPFGFK